MNKKATHTTSTNHKVVSIKSCYGTEQKDTYSLLSLECWLSSTVNSTACTTSCNMTTNDVWWHYILFEYKIIDTINRLQCFDLFAGRQEGHVACKKLSDGMLAWLCLGRGADSHIAQLCHCQSLCPAPVNPDCLAVAVAVVVITVIMPINQKNVTALISQNHKIILQCKQKKLSYCGEYA